MSIQLDSMNVGFALTDGKARRRLDAFALHRVLDPGPVSSLWHG